jgi:lysozyme
MPNAAIKAAREPLRASDACLELVKAFESCASEMKSQPGFFKPYRDSSGVLTIGWGHTNHHLPRFDGNAIWSQAACDLALAGDMGTFERWVSDHANASLAQCEFDALVSWSFNTGGPATATLWKKLNAGNKAAIPAELAKWNRGGGKVLAGLVRRRKAEGLMFAGKIEEALAVAHG